jgi:hypothetical protein
MNFKCAAVLAAIVLLTGCNNEPEALPIKDFMAKKVQPTAQVYWDAVRFISDETGEHEIMPRTDEEWNKVRQAAIDLQAHGERLKQSPYTDGRGADWSQFAQGMIDVSKLAEQAAVEQNVDKVFEVGGTVYSVCSACHQVYPPAEGEIPALSTPAS